MYNNDNEEGFSLSKRELRKINRSWNLYYPAWLPSHYKVPDNKIEKEIDSIDSNDEEVVFYVDNIDFSTKENTRRIKRSHEKKVKKIQKIEIDESIETNISSSYEIPRKDNSRRGRRENVPKNPNTKRVTFTQENPIKMFQTPKGKFAKDKITFIEKKQHESRDSSLKRSRRPLVKTEEYDDQDCVDCLCCQEGIDCLCFQ